MDDETIDPFGDAVVVQEPDPAPQVVATEPEQKPEEDPFADAQELRLPNEVFDAGEYSRVPSMLSRIIGGVDTMLSGPGGTIANLDLNNPVLAALSQEPEFINAGPMEQQQLIANALRASNKQIYEDAGGREADNPILKFLGIRVQDTIQPQPDGTVAERTQYLPGPGYAEGLAFGEGNLSNAVVGGSLQAIKGITDLFSEDNNATATMPPRNDWDRIGQEVYSIVLGTAAGAGIADKLMELPGVTAATSNWAARTMAKVKGKDPADFAEAAQIVSRVLALEIGMAAGATVTTPEYSEPLLGDDVVEAFGLDAEDNRDAAIFADNLAFAGLFSGAIKLGGMVGRGFSKVFPISRATTQRGRDAHMAASYLRAIDPMAEDAKGIALVNRANILSEVVERNSTFAAEALSDAPITADTTTAIFAGAREYVERAYVHRKAFMSNEEWTAFVDEQAGIVATRAIDIKRSRISSDIVRQSDAAMTGQIVGAIESGAERLGGKEATARSAAAIAEDAIERLNTAFNVKQMSEIDVAEANAALDEALRNNDVVAMLRNAQGDNSVGSVGQSIALDRLLASDLFRGYLESYKGYKAAFDNLPEVTAGVSDVVEAINTASGFRNSFDEATKDSVRNPTFQRLLDAVAPKEVEQTILEEVDGELVEKIVTAPETPEMIIERLADEGVTFTQIFKEIRPRLELAIRNGVENSQDVSALIDVKRAIDATAEDLDVSEFQDALGLYQAHASVFLETQPLRDFASSADTVVEGLRQGSGAMKGEADALLQARRAIEQSLSPENAEYMQPMLVAIRTASGEAPNATISASITGRAMQALATSVQGGRIENARQIVDAIGPYVDTLRDVDPAAYDTFNTIVKDLQALEADALSAEQFTARATAAYTSTLAEVNRSAAANFIYDITGNPEILENTGAAFNKIFNSFSSNSNILRRIMDEARATGNPDVAKGIQAQYLTWLSGQLTAARRIGVESTEAGMEAVRDVKPGALDRLIRDPDSPVLRNMSIIFEGNEEMAVSAIRLLDLQDMIITGRSVRGETFGSTTAYDLEIKKLTDRMTVLVFGVLNPTATMVRNISEAALSGYRKNAQEATLKTLDLMITSPEAFQKSMELLARGEERGAREFLIPFLRGPVNAALDNTETIARGVYSAEPEPNEDLPDGWEQYLRILGRDGDLTKEQWDQEMQRLFPNPLNPDATYGMPFVESTGSPSRP